MAAKLTGLNNMIATWFGLGSIKHAPGTWGTLGAVPLVVALSWAGPWAYMAITMALVVLAMVVSERYQQEHKREDPSEVVIDEVAGFCVTMVMLPITWQALAAGFLLFRFFDVLKPPPIRWFDQSLKGGVGVVADDIVAGVLSNVLLQLVFVQTTWLGYQYVL